jgi:hypothetical protein
MQIGKVEGRYAKRVNILFNILKTWLILSVILSFLCILSMFIELILYGSGYSLIPFFFVQPLFPVLALISVYGGMKRIPAAISIYSDRLIFHYDMGFKDMDKTMFWGDVVELIPYDRIRDNRNQIVRFPVLERKDMERILWTAERIENLDIDKVWQIRNLDEAVNKVLKVPMGQITISKRSWLRAMYFTFLWLFSAIILWMAVNSIFRWILFGDDETIVIAIGLFVISFPVTVLSVICVIQQVRKREIRIDMNGIRFLYRTKIRYSIKWQDIYKISNKRGSSTKIVVLHLKSGKKKKISGNEFAIKEIMKAFEMIKGYCSYHGIKIDNRLDW